MDGSQSQREAWSAPGVGGEAHLAGARPPPFGREDLAAVYRKAKDLAIRRNVFRMIQVVEVDGIKQLIICNLWRIDRHPDQRVRTFEFDLQGEVWKEVTSIGHWPDVTLFPIHKCLQGGWWRHFIQPALWKVLHASGYVELPRYRANIQTWVDDGYGGGLVPAPGEKREMSPGRMGHQFISRFIGRCDPMSKGKTRWRGGVLKTKSMEAGARALRAAVWDHLIEREVFSAICTISGKMISLGTYMPYAQHREGLLKVAREHRNLLPLLTRLDAGLWSRDDLFSRRLWVKDGRKTTPLDHPPFRRHESVAGDDGAAGGFQGAGGLDRLMRSCADERDGYASFGVASAWRWLSRASSVVVRDWQAFAGGVDSQRAVVTNLALANVSERVPVIAYSHVMSQAPSLARFGVSPPIQRLLRVFLQHSARLWKDKGHAEVRAWLKSGAASFSVMVDYLQAEGFAQGQPDRQSTWPSLMRRSDDWHRRIAIERMEQQFSGKNMVSWESALEETTINGIVFVPLVNSKVLAVEGYDMHHCVGSYDHRCQRGTYRVFAVRDADGGRSTLGFEVSGSKVRWDQHMGRHNALITGPVADAGRQLVQMYGEALGVSRKRRKAALAEAPAG